SGSGSVSGGGSYNSGTSVEVRATPTDSRYEFSSWGGACFNKPNPCTLTMDSDRNVSASFTRVYSISASAGTGGTVSCPNCGSSVRAGASVSASTRANSGYQFSGWSWSGNTNPCASAGSSCSFSAGESGTLTANFSQIAPSPPKISGSDFVKEEHWALLSGRGTGQRCDSPYLNGVCDKIVPVFTSPSVSRVYAPGESFRVTGSSSFIKGYTNEVGLSISYPGFSQNGIVQFGPYRPRSSSIDFDFGPFTMPSQPGTYRIQIGISFLFGGSGNLEWFSGYLPVTVSSPPREVIYPTAVTGDCGAVGKINLSWAKADATKWAGYRLYRFDKDPLVDGTAYQIVTVIRDINQTTYTDTTPKQNTRYWYEIKTLTRAELGAVTGLRNIAGVLLAQSGGVVNFGSGLINSSDSAVSSGPCVVADFTPKLTASPPKVWQTCRVTFTPSAFTNPIGGAVTFSRQSCGAGGTKVTGADAPALPLFACTYFSPSSYQASVTSTYLGKEKSAAAPVTVVAAAPKVALYISDEKGNCLGDKTTSTQIIKESKAKLCWKVEPIDCTLPTP
ncbi:MAG: hypothetical protein HYS57_02935, partial [Parcubacteria group bacterium]|nr:hypothetical protein [Parcubacteria group bacterium]